MVSHHVHSADVYRLFLQAALSRRVMSDAVAKALWKACYEAVARADPTKDIQFSGQSADWDEFLTKIQRMLDPLDLEFARAKDEETGKTMYAIANTKGDEVAQLASDYSPAEIAFFKAVVEQIILSSRQAYSVSSILALREASHLKGFQITKSQAEVILASLVARGWLVKSKRGRYSLSTRSILELSSYLKNTYEDTDLLECVVCMELVTKGVMCSTANCGAALHKHCYRAGRKNKCPKCQQAWGDSNVELILVGEDAIKDDKQEKRRVRRQNGAEEVEEEEEESQEMTQTQTQTQSQSQGQTQTQTQTQRRASKSGKNKKAGQAKTNGRLKKRAMTPDTAEDDDDMYDDDEPQDGAIDIDNLDEIRERPSARNRGH